MATQITTLTSAKAWSPDLQYFAAEDAVPTAAILQATTIAGSIEGDEPAVRVPWIDDASAVVVPEGGDIPEADPRLAETTIYTSKTAQMVRLSREQLAQPDASELVMHSVQRAIVTAADRLLLTTGTPSSSALTAAPAPRTVTASTTTGSKIITATDGAFTNADIGAAVSGPGVSTSATIAKVTDYRTAELSSNATATAAGVVLTVTPGAAPSVTGSLDALVDAVAAIEADGGQATMVIAHPTAWAALSKLKTASGSAMALLGAGTDAAERRVLSMAVITSSGMPPGNLLVLDQRAVVSAVGDVQLATSDQRFFESDSIAVRVTWRLGWSIMSPARIRRLTIA